MSLLSDTDIRQMYSALDAPEVSYLRDGMEVFTLRGMRHTPATFSRPREGGLDNVSPFADVYSQTECLWDFLITDLADQGVNVPLPGDFVVENSGLASEVRWRVLSNEPVMDIPIFRVRCSKDFAATAGIGDAI